MEHSKFCKGEGAAPCTEILPSPPIPPPLCPKAMEHSKFCQGEPAAPCTEILPPPPLSPPLCPKAMEHSKFCQGEPAASCTEILPIHFAAHRRVNENWTWPLCLVIASVLCSACHNVLMENTMEKYDVEPLWLATIVRFSAVIPSLIIALVTTRGRAYKR
ncbi:hypothetical protein ACFX2I_037200 [Malus domestica]|uniref:WAT1-related protein n=1 Tax=Malus domestica TaxID=3750 RepID=A0A498JTB2_MALDO|nr:uncharacterized protein LOC114825585 [Malus domestica]RXH96792.1 hypothetical protein DVH24_009634 [Malus domestica]